MPSHTITPNVFSTTTGSSPKTTIFFISGNPGLIGYYHPFLSHLAEYLTDETSFQIYGCSLGGFEIGKDAPKELDLEDQIQFVQKSLASLMSEKTGINSASTGNDLDREKVILIGHSVGTYIAMEILNRHRDQPFDIVGGVMLFPTVKDIAASPSGQKLTVGDDRLGSNLNTNAFRLCYRSYRIWHWWLVSSHDF